MTVDSSNRLLQERLDYQFRDAQLLKLALSHRSFGSKNNERLEFLGDGVLECITKYYLYLNVNFGIDVSYIILSSNFFCNKQKIFRAPIAISFCYQRNI